uniref:Uncharacterized protein n=1 Tax=Arundo donax TaxID=35708 RepID=A0A0A9GYC3_ARUDO
MTLQLPLLSLPLCPIPS